MTGLVSHWQPPLPWPEGMPQQTTAVPAHVPAPRRDVSRLQTVPRMERHPVKLAYADPPYLGCCSLYQHRHEEPYGCWDDPERHRELMVAMQEDYDGWALSASSTSLRQILPLAPSGVRVAAWVKPFAAYKRNVRIAYTWEPVLFKPGRDRSADGAPVGRDHLAEPIQLRAGLTGAKPPRFCRWILDLLGYTAGDTVDDLFPGTGVMDLTERQGVLA
jgi:hypothetical protein